MSAILTEIIFDDIDICGGSMHTLVLVGVMLAGVAVLAQVIKHLRSTSSRTMDFEEGEDGYESISLGTVTILVAPEWEKMGGCIWVRGYMQWRSVPLGKLERRNLPLDQVSESDGSKGKSCEISSYAAEGEGREEYRVTFRVARVTGRRRLIVTLAYVK